MLGLSTAQELEQLSSTASSLQAQGVTALEMTPVLGSTLERWMMGSEAEKATFASTAVFIEVKLRRAMQATVLHATPGAAGHNFVPVHVRVFQAGMQAGQQEQTRRPVVDLTEGSRGSSARAGDGGEPERGRQ